ncbi:TonB-dependent receptor [Novosphingobium sp. 9U]|uniref:TonB-dependent receptor n=1 Tax=Novosphingobium sp. 9U TaxID=2653158 RepID=UPI0012F24C0B|nr:TonB-dependent receptor [Novosphingobium sp. 9U]VWX49977.1 TonB-dependent receptor [Novosphingobium sp. 9U]
MAYRSAPQHHAFSPLRAAGAGKRTGSRFQSAFLFASASIVGLSGVAHAQDTPAPASDAAEAQVASASASDTGDIVVTANKREQRLNDVGLTVSVLSAASLQERQISTVAELANTVPSLSYSNSANGTPIYTLRGVGFTEVSLGAYPTVSTYVDEIPLQFSALTTHSAFDLERLEVLKGPQGTLFGENATGGALNYIAAKPTDELHAGGSVSYGRFNEVNGEAFISGPLTDTLKARVAGRVEHGDGWQVSNSRPDDRNGKTRNYMGRLQLAYTPSSSARFLLNVNGWLDRSQTQAPQYIGLFPQLPVVDPLLLASQFSPDKPRAADWTSGLPRKNNRLFQASLRSDISLTDNIELTSLTSYVNFRQRQGDEGDGLPIVTLDLTDNNGTIKTFFQELRVANASSSAFRFVLGANYEHNKVDQSAQVNFPNASSSNTYGQIGYPIINLIYNTDQVMKNYAFFGNVEYDIVPNVTVKGGIRYTNTKDSGSSCSKDESGLTTNTGSLFYDVVLGGALGRYPSGSCFPVNNLATTVNGVAPGRPGEFTGKLNQDNISWKVGVDWKPTPDLLVYGNVAKGYKAGSFPVLSASVFQQYLPVTQESVLSYEGGIKATLLDRALQFNAAGFYYDYRNKQLRSKFLDPNFGVIDILQNVPKSTIKGFELEMTARPIRRLTATAAFTYVDAKIDEFAGINAAGVSADFAGEAIPFTPKYQVNTDLDYKFPLSQGIDGFAGASVSLRSATSAVIGGEINPPTATPQGKALYRIDDYVLVDLRAGVRSTDGRWSASVWGKNIFNQYYWNNVVGVIDNIVRYAGRPATYGVTLGFNY